MATTVKVLLKKEKINKAGEAPLYLRITKDRKTKFVSIGVLVKPQYWDEHKGEVLRGHPNIGYTNAYIAQKVADARKTVLDLQRESKFVPAVHLRAISELVYRFLL